MKHSVRASVLAALCLICAASHADVEPAKRQAIRRLLELTGAVNLGKEIGQTLLSQMRPSFPQVPDSVWDELVASFDPAEATELLVAIHDRHFTLEEIQAMIDFYETPIGHRLLEKLPVVSRESALLGQQWGAAKADEVLRRLAERGFQPVEL